MIPGPALGVIRKKHIYVNLTSQITNDHGEDEEQRGMCYHMSPEWLSSHGNDPAKAGCVEMWKLHDYFDWRSQQPFMVLHELSHSYHHEMLDKFGPRINALYNKMRADGRYNSVSHIAGGPQQKHYAMSSEWEYFAECSEAYWGKNDFSPFVRSELLAFDPEGYQLQEDAWHGN